MPHGARDRIGGLIEVPDLAACLTLNKGDFIRVGVRGATYLGYRKAIQEAVSRQLAAWGDVREPAEDARRRAVRPLQRDLERVLVDLAEDFPLLASLVERRAGGQKSLPVSQRDGAPEGYAVVPTAPSAVRDEGEAGRVASAPSSGSEAKEKGEAPGPPPEREASVAGPPMPGGPGPRRPVRYGLGIEFEDRPSDPELGRLVESTVLVNQAHPAYRRAIASRSEGYHIALTVALALAPLIVEKADEHGFVTAFLIRWGQALDRPKGLGKRRS